MKKIKFLLVFFLSVANFSSAYEVILESKLTKNLGYGDWYIHTDGELHLMEQILRPNSVVFDVGANIGDWSLYALGVEKSIRLYSFEPLPAIFPDLKNKLLKYSNAKVFNLALSNQRGKGNFCFYDETYEFSALSSFYEREVLKEDHQPPKIVEIEQETIFDFCVNHSIKEIDFLKIDAEGAEWIILNGAKPLIEENKIKVIQFEYGGCFVDSKAKLEDIFHFFSDNNYFVFRVMPHGVIWIPQWNSNLENFQLSNYVAIHKNELSLIGISVKDLLSKI